MWIWLLKKHGFTKMDREIVFIDGGANRGQIFDWCFDTNLNTQLDDTNHTQFFIPSNFTGAKFYLFEPTKSLNKHLKSKQDKFPDCEINIINKGLWVKDGRKRLYLCQDERWQGPDVDPSIGNSMYSEQSKKMDLHNPVEIDVVDTAKWVKDYTRPEQYIILKLDIEGAEIEVVKKLIDSELLDSHIDEIHVEWHDKPHIDGLKYTSDKRKNWSITENYFLKDLLRARAYYKRWQL